MRRRGWLFAYYASNLIGAMIRGSHLGRRASFIAYSSWMWDCLTASRREIDVMVLARSFRVERIS